MKESSNRPELYRTEDLHTYADWLSFLVDYGHIWFYLDGTYYFLFPEGPHKYGLCLGEDEATGNFPRWEFSSEDEFLNATMFGGKNIIDRSEDLMSWDPPFFADARKEAGDDRR